ncbi:DUF6880 family protein [Tomitella cavernea]|uniref:Gll2284 protein n=1 Tax=Tomitella cavernea TaxID=1387982 RepID=A0ABP9CMY3_9ACTN|nr:DUF6880 family protein [Tomitella cavernea]
MTALADAVLPLIRTRKELYRLGAANAHGRQMHEAVDLLEDAAAPAKESTGPADVYDVTTRAVASALKVIARADDSSGIIGDACRRLLRLHPRAAAAAHVPPTKVVDWMIAFQFHNDVDFFTIDPVAYAPALGPDGVAAYRARLADIERDLPPEPTPIADRLYLLPHERFVLEQNAQRLAVLDRDVDAIIATHAKDCKVAAWLIDTAKAFEEIDRTDLAIEWAREATRFGGGPQSQRAADYWSRLVDRHRPDEAVDVRLEVFRRWPSSSTGRGLYEASGVGWPHYRDEVTAALAARPREAVLFALLTLEDPREAWRLAHDLGLQDADVWDRLVTEYAAIDPAAVLPVHADIVRMTLQETGAPHYRRAARRLKTMRTLAAKADKTAEVDALIAELRQENRRRPRLGEIFDKARLP